MKRINILTVNNNPNSLSFVYPLLVNRKRLRGKGVDIKFFYALTDEFYDCDCVFIDNKFFTPYWHRVGEGFQHLQTEEEEGIFAALKRAKGTCGAVLWFDNSDSSGTPQFEVLGYVDGYYKNQALKDRALYQKAFYRDRIFFDYYHRKFGITDDYATAREYIPEAEHLDKIHVSWNPALNNHGLFWSDYSKPGKLKARMRRFLPVDFKYTAEFIKVDKPRGVDIAARMGLSHHRQVVKRHRELAADAIKKFNVNTGFVNHSLYYKELACSMLSVSPFGLGEITYRDFESIICGALLIKPDMGHIETWPDLYTEDETYVKCSWDFSDLAERIEGLLAAPEKAKRTAKEAQRNYSYYLSEAGREDFCDRVLGIIERHKN